MSIALAFVHVASWEPPASGRVYPRCFHSIQDSRMFTIKCRLALASGGSLDLDVHAGRQAQLVQRLDGLDRRLHDVDQPLVGADFELLPGLFVHMRAGQDRVPLHARRQGNWAMDDRAGPLGRIHDLRRALVQDGVIVCLHPDTYKFARLASHGESPRSPNSTLSKTSDE
jgi:hypothetical protein